MKHGGISVKEDAKELASDLIIEEKENAKLQEYIKELTSQFEVNSIRIERKKATLQYIESNA
ncbi:MAG: hypothetical protein LBH89_02715 [Lactococcus lactis]|jgi:hypothetical protein|nr:hypothetical protein [Lactococcus lactis]